MFVYGINEDTPCNWQGKSLQGNLLVFKKKKNVNN